MGKPAARITDVHVCPLPHPPNAIVQGSPDVFTNSLPAARVGDSEACGSTIAMGSSGVFINGKPAARLTDPTTHGGKITTGSGDVFIGEKKFPPVHPKPVIRKGKASKGAADSASGGSAAASQASAAPAAESEPEYTFGEEATKVLSDKWEGIKDSATTLAQAMPMVGDDASRTQARDDIVQGAKDMAQGLNDLAGPNIVDNIESTYGLLTGDPEKANTSLEKLERMKDVWGNIVDSAVDSWNEAEERNGTLGAVEMAATAIGAELIGGKGAGALSKGVGAAGKAGKASRLGHDGPDLDSGKSLDKVSSDSGVGGPLDKTLNKTDKLTSSLANDAESIISSSTKGQLRKQAALSRASADELGIVSKNYTNIPGTVKNFPGVRRLDDDFFVIDNKTDYIKQVEKLYADSGNKLNSATKIKILEHVGDGSKKFPTQAGIPGLHAEVQSVNSVINQVSEGFDLSKINVSTIKLAPGNGQGLPFPACSNCGGILSNSVNVLTGVK